MNLEQSVGQLFTIGFYGTTVTEELRKTIEHVCPGGIILFTRNVRNPIQLAELCTKVQQLAIQSGGLPLFIAIDQEGGVVSRLTNPFTIFPSQGELEKATYEEIYERGKLMARELKLVGCNFNLAPVLDVRRSDDSTKNYWRSFSEDPDKVAASGTALIRGLQDNGVLACAKHFPGLGRAQVDPHVDLPIVEGGVDNELIPFREAVSGNVAAVMMSHAVYPALDPGVQASISNTIIEGLLRRDLGFEGLVVTDDLEMGAVAKTFTLEECSTAALEAGADVFLICSKLEEISGCYEKILDIVGKSASLRKNVGESVDRIVSAKTRFLLPYTPHDIVEVEDYFHRFYNR